MTVIFRYEISNDKLEFTSFKLRDSEGIPQHITRFNETYSYFYTTSFFSKDVAEAFMRDLMAKKKPGAYVVLLDPLRLGNCLFYKDTDGSFVNPDKTNCLFLINGEKMRGSLLRVEDGKAVVAVFGAEHSDTIPLSDVLKFAE